MDKPVFLSEVVTAAKNGEEAAWKFLYNQCYPFLYATALRIWGNTPTAKDAVQDTFLSAYLHLHQLKNVAAFRVWLKQILLHNCYRKRVSTHRYLDIVPFAKDEWWEDEIERKEVLFYEQSRLFETVAKLAEPLRCSLLLRYFSTFSSYEQIATILCVPVGTIRSRLNEARSKFIVHWQNSKDVNEQTHQRAEEWNAFYYHHFTGMYESESVKHKLIEHFDKKIEITFTSGKTDSGRDYFEEEIENDLHFGTRYQLMNVVSCGHISVVEGTNYNPPQCPDRCPSSSVFVLFREKERVHKLNLYNSLQ